MIIYNKTWLANLRLLSSVKNAHRAGCITDAELKLIEEKHTTGFYSPNLFVRTGLSILTCIIALFTGGFLSLIMSWSGLVNSPAWLFFLAVICYIALEFMVGRKNQFRSGVDDALLLMTCLLINIGLYWALSEINNFDADYLTLSGVFFVIGLLFTIRFADMLMATISCISFFAFIFFMWTNMIPSGLSTAPFIMILASAFAYRLAYINSKKEKFIDYGNCFIIAQIACLVILYAAGNYYVIQTLSSQLNGDAPVKAVPFGWFFWLWTILLPFVYVLIGLKRKDVILLRAGLLLIITAVLTFRMYYHVLPVDVTLTLAGTILLGIAYATVKYLKTPKHGFTYAEQDDPHLMDHLKVESLIIAETFSKTGAAPAGEEPKFGGGDFGGGGSSSSF